MSVINQLASSHGRRDEVPNWELAHKLAENEDRQGIAEIATNLWNRDPNIQADCIKVLYEIGYIQPELVAGYASDVIKLLATADRPPNNNNRLVWGAMLALSTIAGLTPDAIMPHLPEIQLAMARGSVITRDAGIKTLASLAATSSERRQEIFPFLLEHLRTCRPKDVPQHAEAILVAASAETKGQLIAVLQERLDDMAEPQARRVKRVIRQANAITKEA